MFALALTASGGSGNSASATSNQSSIDGGHDVNSSEAASEPEEHGLSPKAVEIARPLGFPITNSMLVSWIVALGLIVFAQAATRDMKLVPTRLQNFIEWLVSVLSVGVTTHLTDS